MEQEIKLVMQPTTKPSQKVDGFDNDINYDMICAIKLFSYEALTLMGKLMLTLIFCLWSKYFDREIIGCI